MATRPSFHIVPCGAEKATTARRADALYLSTTFRLAIEAARAQAAFDGGEVLILSAKHGLLRCGDVVAPYDTRMGDPGSISAETLRAQALALGIDWGCEVWAYLPRAYFARLDEALRGLDVYAAEVYEATGGIGDQRRVCAIARAA